MKFLAPSIAVLLTLSGAAHLLSAQAPAPLAFEVAVVRPAPSLQDQITSGQIRVGSTITDSRIDLKSAALGELVILAYKLKPYQLVGPDWIRQARYDVQGTYPPGATKDQMPEMLQALLADRFKLQIRRDTKEMAAFELVVDKGGHTLKPATPAPETPAPAGPNEQTLSLAGQEIRINAATRSASVETPEGSMRIAPGEGGIMRIEADRITMASLADLLTTFMGKPVVDRTGLTERYLIPLEIRQEDMLAMARAQAQAAGITLPAAALGGGAPGVAADPGGASSVPASLRKLGLRLDARDVPIDVVAVESAEQTPSED